MNVPEIVQELLLDPTEPVSARRPAAIGGLPDEAGLYAWWLADRSKLPQVPAANHSLKPDLSLLYVGIAPVDAQSSATLRSRVIGNHLSGNIAASTFRFSLAALLMRALNFVPLKTSTKVVLSRDDNQRLTDWQHANLRISWCRLPEPWQVESAVISVTKPPFNLAENSVHPFYKVLKQARADFRDAAGKEMKSDSRITF